MRFTANYTVSCNPDTCFLLLYVKSVPDCLQASWVDLTLCKPWPPFTPKETVRIIQNIEPRHSEAFHCGAGVFDQTGPQLARLHGPGCCKCVLCGPVLTNQTASLFQADPLPHRVAG